VQQEARQDLLVAPLVTEEVRKVAHVTFINIVTQADILLARMGLYLIEGLLNRGEQVEAFIVEPEGTSVTPLKI
jgi:hypothetical protein